MDLKDFLVLLSGLGVAILTFYLGKWQEKTNRRRERDKLIYEKIIEYIPGEFAADFLRDLDMGGLIRDNDFFKLSRATYFLNQPGIHFIDNQIEKAKKQLCVDAEELKILLALNTFPTRNADANRIESEFMDSEEFHTLQKKLNDMSSKVYEDYVRFIKLSTDRLT